MANEKSYIPTQWKDQVKDGSTIIQPGTPMNAQNFNNMEHGILANDALAAVLAQVQRQAMLSGAEFEVESGSATISPANTDNTISIVKLRNRTTYNVTVEVNSVSGGNYIPVGDIIISGKQANGFKVKYTGTATSVTIRYHVQGGMV